MKSFVIETSGKQIEVHYGETITIDSLLGKKGDIVNFDKVLLVRDGEKIDIGSPYVKGVSVEGEVIKNGRGEIVKIGKYKSKVHYRRKMGSKTHTTEILIKEPGVKKTVETKTKEKPVTAKKVAVVKKSTSPRKRKTETK
jgi:large subunit ribosomal protein L21